jgi:undecaprenyl-diphosphatase
VHTLISYFQAAVLGLVQGIAEPFPISSLGHSVILPRLAGWNIHQSDPYFITFLVATHLATAIVLFGFFFDDWRRIIKGLLRSVRGRSDPTDTDARLGWLLVIGTVPAGVIGLALQKPLQNLFASAAAAAGFLVLNGVGLLVFERLRARPQVARPAESGVGATARARAGSRAAARVGAAAAAGSKAADGSKAGAGEPSDAPDARLARLSFRQALLVGLSQAAALIPGISRSGVSMGGGLLAGLSNEDAARFAFLLATPIIGAAALLKLPQLLGSDGDGIRGPALVGAICAGVTTFFAVKYLLKYFETSSLRPFGAYCIAAGLACLAIFALGG